MFLFDFGLQLAPDACMAEIEYYCLCQQNVDKATIQFLANKISFEEYLEVLELNEVNLKDSLTGIDSDLEFIGFS